MKEWIDLFYQEEGEESRGEEEGGGREKRDYIHMHKQRAKGITEGTEFFLDAVDHVLRETARDLNYLLRFPPSPSPSSPSASLPPSSSPFKQVSPGSSNPLLSPSRASPAPSPSGRHATSRTQALKLNQQKREYVCFS
jgi:hypothetical protein